MKLVRLAFEGVGSFADPMEIDFETLGSAGLFLIEGPTGSGKSTILDAIVFALYGSPAGTDSDPGRLDSHVRSSNREPFVELDFTCHGSTYRIRRTPRHERDKRRGTGMKVDEGGVSLTRLRPDPEGISHKAREVGDWVVEHVGLTKQQFVSTIVLAQGEFSTFLNAETKDRTPILEKVFGTQFYQQVEQQLAAMRKEALTERSGAGDRFDEAVDRCLGLLTLTTDVDPVHAIDAEVERLGQEAADLVRREQGSRAALGAAEDQLGAARVFVEKQKAKRLLTEQHAGLLERESQMTELRDTLADHERARPVMAALQAWRSAQRDVSAAREEVDARAGTLAALGEPAASPARLTEVVGQRGELAAALAAERELPAAQADVVGAREILDRRSGDLAGCKSARERVAEQVAADQVAAQRPPGDAERLAALQVEQSELAVRLADRERLAGVAADVAEAQRQLAIAKEAVVASDLQLAQGRLAQLHNVAATLAEDLTDGDPCLVCGSREHPAPARGSDDAVDIAALESLVDRRRHAEAEARSTFDRLESEARILRERLAGGPDDPESRLKGIEAELIALREEVGHAQAAAERARTGQEELADLDRRIDQLRLLVEEAQALSIAAVQRAGTLHAAVEGGLAGFATVSGRVARLTEVQDALTRALASEATLGTAQRAVSQSEAILTRTLTEVGLADAAAAEAALLPESEAAERRRAIDVFDREVREVETRLRELTGIDTGVVTDIGALEGHVEEHRQAHAEVHKALGRVQHTLREALPLRETVAQRAREREEVIERTRGVIRMADLATASRGEVVHRVRLSAFVLMRRFESVVEAANDRLDAISEGRYQLKVLHTGLDNRGQAGLDLVVEDQRTERCRPTTSLSGGESFYVSLALALGLADVVRSESGGVSLGTLFIDEGFGSLDADVLEEVIDMLEQVRAGEDRVIGLVSHVDVLKQRIDPRISVRRDPLRAGVSTLQVSV